MAVGIIRTAWAGTTGGPGLSQVAIAETSSGGSGSFFTTSNVQVAVDAMRAYWMALAGLLPNELTLTVQQQVDIYDELDGKLIASIAAPTAPVTVVGTDTGVYAMAAGMKAGFETGVIRNGRRVRGSLFIVPSGSTSLTIAGNVNSAARTTVNTAGTNFKNALATPLLKHVVYSRPVYNSAGVLTRNGALAEVSGYAANEKTAILRGRRD